MPDDSNKLARLIKTAQQAFADEQKWRDDVANPCQDYYDGNPNEHRQGSDDEEIRKCSQVNENEIGPQIDGVLGENEFIGYEWRVRAFKNTDEAMSIVLDELLAHARMDGEMEAEDARKFKDGVVLGRGLVEVLPEKQVDGTRKITLEYVPWNECFIDRACQRMDLKRARYAGRLRWVGYDDAKAKWGINPDDLSPDKPMNVLPTEGEPDSEQIVWNDKKNSRIHVCEMWGWEGKTVHRYTFTDGKLLDDEADPLTNPDRPEGVTAFNKIPLVPYFVKFDKQGNPYGLVSNMLHSQDMIDMHSSRARFELLSLRLIHDSDAFDMTDTELDEQMADPACHLITKPGAIAGQKFVIKDGMEKAQVHSGLSAQHSQRLQLVSGISTAFQGVREGYESSGSRDSREERSRRILGTVFSNARRSQILEGKMWLELAAQWMTEEQFVRITENGIRRLREIGAQSMLETAQANGGAIPFNASMLAAMKYDVTIDKVASDPNRQHSQYLGLVELAKSGAPIPPEEIIMSSDLPNKERLMSKIAESRKNQQPPPDVMAKAAKDQADAQLKMMQAQMMQVESQVKVQELQAQAQVTQLDAQLKKIQAQVEMEHMAVDARRLDSLEKKTLAEVKEVMARVEQLLADAEKKRAEADAISGPQKIATLAQAHKSNTEAEMAHAQREPQANLMRAQASKTHAEAQTMHEHRETEGEMMKAQTEKHKADAKAALTRPKSADSPQRKA